jgi:hypothetical protein
VENPATHLVLLARRRISLCVIQMRVRVSEWVSEWESEWVRILPSLA